MKTLTLALLLAATLSASNLVCPPVMSPDSQTVTPNCPGLGERVYALPDSTYRVMWNDNRRGHENDNDYNDLAATITTDILGNATATWTGSNSGFNNSMWFGSTFLFSNSYHPGPVPLGNFANGVELAFSLLTPEFQVWHTGPAARNSDWQVHAWVEGGANIPEPGTISLFLGGLAAMAGWARRWKVRA